MSEDHPSDYWFPLSKKWNFYLLEIPRMTLAAGETRELLGKYEAGWLTWLFMRSNSSAVRLKVQFETPESSIVPWSYTPLELFTNALAKWLPLYDTVNGNYVVDAQFNPWIPYNVSITAEVINEGATVAIISRFDLLRIKLTEKNHEYS